MLATCLQAVERAILDLHCRALLAGGLLGTVAWGLSQGDGQAAYRLAMAGVVIVSGSLSFVFYALDERRRRPRRGARTDRARAAAAVRGWVCVLGLGICLALEGLQAAA